jgi:D-alanyl-D-alanine carboxypeptidase
MSASFRRCRGVVAVVAVMAALSAFVAVPAAGDGSGPGVRTVQRMLDDLTRDARFPGALAYRRDGRGRATTVTSGTAELGTGRPMVGADARLRVASATKIFTSVVVLQLVAEGRVGLDEPVERYLPGVVRGTGAGAGIDGRAITVRQILQHTSGLANYRAGLDWSRIYTTAELVSLGLSGKAVFPVPGTGWAYSNTNYALAGMLIERLTGHAVGAEVKDRIIRPLGLRGTYWPGPGEWGIRGEHAHEYGIDPAYPASGRTDVTEFNVSVLDAGGALISTPVDLARFYAALFGGTLLVPRMLLPLLATYPLAGAGAQGFPERAEYGLGLLRIPLSCGGFYYSSPGDLAGIHVRGGIDENGTQFIVYATTLPANLAEVQQVTALVDTAFCTWR